MLLGKVLEGSGVRYCVGFRDIEILSVAEDSRKVRPGALFVAVRGAASDGHEYLREALARGAGALAVESLDPIGCTPPAGVPVVVVADSRKAVSRIAANFHGSPAKRVRVVGITGTNGKTTTSYFARSVLEAAGYGAGLIGTIRHHSGTRILEAGNTTPGPLEIHALLREMESSGLPFAVMEVSSHGLDQGRVADIAFVAGIFTNLASDHLDYHKTRADYLKAKARLFEGLEPRSIAILNRDDWASPALLQRCGARAVLYGRGPEADLRWQVADSGLWGSDLALSWQGRALGTARIVLPGTHNAANAAAAAAFGMAAQFPEERVLQGLRNLKGVPGRLEEVDLKAPFKVYVDFAHTEGALRSLLQGLRAVHPGRILLVFGCGGDRDRTKRPRMGRVAGELSERCWVTSDNPRTEDPDAIIREIEGGIPSHAWYAVEPHRERAIREALAAAEAGDAVVIAGKGHENTQKIGREIRRFDDCEVVRAVWREISGEGETAELASAASASV